MLFLKKKKGCSLSKRFLWLIKDGYTAVVIIENIVYKDVTLNWSSIRTTKTINFPFVPNGKLMVSRCPNISKTLGYFMEKSS